MSTAEITANDDISFLDDDIHAEQLKAKQVKSHNRKTATGSVKVRSSVQKAKDDYKSAKRVHRAEIKADKVVIREKKRSIKSHRLMMKQARNTYRLIKLTNKK